MKRSLGLGSVLALGFTVLLATPAQAADRTIMVPTDFDHALSDTRLTGHSEVVGTGLHLWTDGGTSTDKVAEYVDTDVPLEVIGEPTFDYTNTSSGGVPGFQLVTDFGGDGTADGILVGEPGAYGDDWWLNDAAEQFVKVGAPSHTAGSGSADHGTLDQWRAAFPGAQVLAFGFSLGSGVKGDGILNAIEIAGDRYTFREAVTLTGKDECKNGGWATSTNPPFRNQGACVSSFTSKKK